MNEYKYVLLRDLETIDNMQWIHHHSPNIKKMEQDRDSFAAYVKQYHPLNGAPFDVSKIEKLKGTESLQIVAREANVICMHCVSTFELHDLDTVGIKNLNRMEIANIAYLAIYHPQSNVRDYALKKFNMWKKYRTSFAYQWNRFFSGCCF